MPRHNVATTKDGGEYRRILGVPIPGAKRRKSALPGLMYTVRIKNGRAWKIFERPHSKAVALDYGRNCSNQGMLLYEQCWAVFCGPRKITASYRNDIRAADRAKARRFR